MEILSVEQLSKSYGDKILFNQLSFSIGVGERIGLVGVNGTGKTTFLNVLAGKDVKDAGTIKHAKDFTVAYLAQEPELNFAKSVLDEVFSGEAAVMVALREYEQALFKLTTTPDDKQSQTQFSRAQQRMDEIAAWDANTLAKTILTKLGVTQFHQPIDQLSGGQKKRVALAKALIQPANLLILDEPTNHLDHKSIEWLEQFLPSYKGAILLVTHDRYFLNRVTNRIYELDLGNLYQYIGNYETYLEKKQERLQLAAQDEQKHANTLKREVAWLKRGAKARTTKQKARIDRVEAMKKESFDTKQNQLEVGVGTTRLGKKVIELVDVEKSYNSVQVVKPFSFLIKPGDRIGIVGENGSGKTTLLNMIAGLIQPDQGMIEIGSTVKFGYYTQDYREMDEDLKLIEYIRETADIIQTADETTITAEQMLERFLFPRSQQWTLIRRLSGGEKRRLYLLKILMEEPNVLLLDEPTNDLDTQTLAILEDYLDLFPGVVITVSHDRYFLDRVVEQLFYFEQQATIHSFYGNYSECLQLIEQESQAQEPHQTKAPIKKARRRKLSYNEQKEWDTIEDEITALEEKIETEKQAVITAGADAEGVRTHYDCQLELEAELTTKLERWEELSMLVEELEQQ
ncbi:ATP-binding cassette, subfamily F, uup [Amphibacillus marinus]|uniref:ATP-binding cassette, subfamily F, uup n=1 Tax=Amphibacillus marinus TaxID=872970 RepID=A0A1H8MXG6_9BACI|nr:ATP-binding cassette, subfamily F, uup [Amphibacillus marinus]